MQSLTLVEVSPIGQWVTRSYDMHDQPDNALAWLVLPASLEHRMRMVALVRSVTPSGPFHSRPISTFIGYTAVTA